MSKKRLAFIIQGGIGTGHFNEGIPILNSFVRRLAVDHQVTVFSVHPVHPDFSCQDFRVYSPSTQKSTLGQLVWLFLRFREVNTSGRFQILHAVCGYRSGFFGAILKKLFQIPLIIHLQGADAVSIPEIGYGVFYRKKIAMLAKFAYSQANHLVVLSHYQGRRLSEHYFERSPIIIPYGVEYSQLAPPQRRPLQEPYQLLHVAHINRVKDQRTLLDAFKIIKSKAEVVLTMMGEDTLDGEIQHYAQEIGVYDSVRFLGFQPHTEVMKSYTEAHILLHTSLYEAQAVAVLEGIASGLVVCGTDVGILSDLSPKYTLVSAVRDSEALAENVSNVLNDPGDFEKRVAAGSQYAKAHDLAWTVRQVEGLYDQCIGLSILS